MSDNIKWILVVAVFAVIILGIRFVVSTVVHKGADPIQNVLIDRKNAKSPRQQENLADRFREK